MKKILCISKEMNGKKCNVLEAKVFQTSGSGPGFESQLCHNLTNLLEGRALLPQHPEQHLD